MFQQFIRKQVNLYRVIAATAFIAAAVLALAIPVRMIGASPWAYYFGVQNFAQGKLVVDDQLHTEQVEEASRLGGSLMQYVEIGDNQWALEKAPGYTLFQVPFEWLGVPRLANVVLALGMVIVTFILLRRLRDERTACIGSLLMLFTPVSLIMLNNAYFDSMAALAFLVMGGGLYFYYQLTRDGRSPGSARGLLFAAFFLISWSVITRYTNFTVAAVIGLHYVITRWRAWRRSGVSGLRLELLPVALGVMVPLAVLLVYNYAVFGSITDYGYKYTRFPIDFAFQLLGQVDQNGQSVPLQIILDNLKASPLPLLWGFPILVIGIPALAVVLYFKFRRGGAGGRWSSLSTEMPWDLLLVLIGWFVAVFGLYLTYEFTAEYLGANQSYIRFARFYLPGLFPIVIISSLVIARLRFRLFIPLLAAAVILGSVFYTQYTLAQDTHSNSRERGTLERSTTERSSRPDSSNQTDDTDSTPRLTPTRQRPSGQP